MLEIPPFGKGTGSQASRASSCREHIVLTLSGSFCRRSFFTGTPWPPSAPTSLFPRGRGGSYLMDEPLNRDSVSFVLGCEGSFRVGLEGRPCPWLVTVTPELSRALQESFSSVLKVVFPTSSGRFLRLPLNRFRTLLGNRSTIYEPLKSGSDGKASVCNAGDPVSIPGLERSPGEGNGSPLQYSCLENPMNLGAW